MTAEIKWWAKGRMLENCNCRLVCRCHISYHQPADHDRCIGAFAIVVGEGTYGEVDLAGVSAFFSVNTPQQMLEGDWTAALILDEAANAEQRQAMETIFSGAAGGAWGTLGLLIGNWLPVRTAPIQVDDASNHMAMWSDGIFEASVKPIKGADKINPVRLENIHNQVHGPSQVLARGTSSFDAGAYVLEVEGTHAICSEFSWSGP